MKCTKSIRAILFLTIGIIMYLIIVIIMIPKKYIFEDDVYGFNDQMSDFYSQPRDTIDVLVLGASHPNLSIIPIEMYNQYGFTSYNLASSSQVLETSELLLKEALKYQKLRVVVFDVSRLFDDKSFYTEMDYDKNYRAIMGVRNLFDRLKYLIKMCPDNMSFWQYISPLYRFHGRWSDLCSDDFFFYEVEYSTFLYGGLIAVNKEPWYGGTFKRPEILNFHIDDNYTITNEDVIEEEIIQGMHSICLSGNSIHFFESMMEICRENDIKLICIKAPTATSWTEDKAEIVKEYLTKEHISYIDFLYGDTGVSYDWDNDTSDHGYHTNYYGAMKTTSYLGTYLNELGILEDHRNDDKYCSWDASYRAYNSYVKKLTMSDEEKSHAFLDCIATNLGEKIIAISVLDDVAYGWDDSWSAPFTNMGLKNDFHDNYRSSYLAFINEGVVAYEDYGDASLLYKTTFSDEYGDHRVEIRSEGLLQGNECLIKIDGKEYQTGEKGFNIVVYDKKIGEVIASVAIDTYPPVYFNAIKAGDL